MEGKILALLSYLSSAKSVTVLVSLNRATLNDLEKGKGSRREDKESDKRCGTIVDGTVGPILRFLLLTEIRRPALETDENTPKDLNIADTVP